MPAEPTAATAGNVELQVPPGTASVRFVVAPAHTEAVPMIVPALATGFTVTTLIAAVARPQLFVTVYEIMEVPAETPETKPVLPTVATEGETELHVPPVTPSVSAIVDPAHTKAIPEMVPALPDPAFTVTECIAEAVPQPLVTL